MKENKKVLHIVEAFGGGVFTMISDLLNELDDNYENIIAYSLRPQTPENFKEYFNKKVKFIEVKNFDRKISLSKDFKALLEINKMIKEEKPNIIHLHSSKAGIIGRMAVNAKKIKMFYNPHGFSFLKQDDSKIKRCIYWLIEKFVATLNRKCTIIGCSNGEYKEALKISKNSKLINNGIDVNKLNKEINKINNKEINEENLKICTVGRIGYQKNPKLFNLIAEKFPNIEFTWIGEGELREELKSNNINITGWKNRNEVLEYISKNDIFILPSLWEGLPISLLEAMYMKKICIVSNVVGNRDVIQNGENGFVCETVEDFADIIRKIQNNSYDLNNIVNNAYDDILQKYNTKVMAEKYKELYI